MNNDLELYWCELNLYFGKAFPIMRACVFLLVSGNQRQSHGMNEKDFHLKPSSVVVLRLS